MNRLVNFIGIVVLCGILLKLSYVFIYLFDEPDAGSRMEPGYRRYFHFCKYLLCGEDTA